MSKTTDHPARIHSDVKNAVANGGWNYDAYPDLEPLDAGKTITVADLQGPGQINTIHITQMVADLFGGGQKGLLPGEPNPTARAVVLKIFFDGTETPAVNVPLGDFFADGLGNAAHYSTPFVEKTPGSYNSYFAMPFGRSARVTLTNESEVDLINYTYVEWQTLPEWDDSLGYFHASWKRQGFQLDPETQTDVFTLQGPGHLVGQYWLLQSDEPAFQGLSYMMEANNQYLLDGSTEPALNYLGTECAFNFSWGWREVFSGYKVGVNWVDPLAGQTGVSTYRFRDRDVVHFGSSLQLKLDWTSELRGFPQAAEGLRQLKKRSQEGGNWVDYATTTYWYSTLAGGDGQALPPVEYRVKPLLRNNPPHAKKED